MLRECSARFGWIGAREEFAEICLSCEPLVGALGQSTDKSRERGKCFVELPERHGRVGL
jgi:hypothetical protein